jgi:hypothetical protein
MPSIPESSWIAPAGFAAAGTTERPSRLRFDPAVLQRDYNRRPFAFQHELHREPALRMDVLHSLALRLEPQHVRHSSAHIPVTADFMNADRDHPTGLSLAYTMEYMDTAGSYVLIANPQTDPAFGRFFNELVAEIHAQVQYCSDRRITGTISFRRDFDGRDSWREPASHCLRRWT